MREAAGYDSLTVWSARGGLAVTCLEGLGFAATFGEPTGSGGVNTSVCGHSPGPTFLYGTRSPTSCVESLAQRLIILYFPENVSFAGVGEE